MYAYMHIYTVGEGNTCLHLCAFIYTTGNTIIAKSLEYTVIALVVKYKHQPIICNTTFSASDGNNICKYIYVHSSSGDAHIQLMQTLIYIYYNIDMHSITHH